MKRRVKTMGDIELEEEVVLGDLDLDVVYLGETTTDHSRLQNLGYDASGHTGFQRAIDSNNKLSSDLVDDTNANNKFVTSDDISNWNTKVDKNVDDLTYYYTKTEVDGKIGSVYKYSGTVATYADLPDTGLSIGDVYNVEEDGSNYAWTGTTWDKLGGDIDLSNYQTKIDSSNKLNADLVDDTNTTNKFVSSSDLTKLSGIESGAQVNVQANWNESDSASDTYIQNKPTVPTKVSDLTNDSIYLDFKGIYSSVNATNYFDFRGKGAGIYFVRNYASVDKGMLRFFQPSQNHAVTTTVSTQILIIVQDVSELLDNVTEDTYFAYGFGFDAQGQINLSKFYVDRTNTISVTASFDQYFKTLTTSNQSFEGEKYFYSKVRSPIAPTADDNLANKKYVDDAIASAITDALGGSY